MKLYQKIFLFILFCAWGFVLYANTLKSSFQFDDYGFIVRNVTIKNFSSLSLIWDSVLKNPSRFVAFFTFAINYHFSQLNETAYHLTNLVFHIISALLVWWFVNMLLRSPKGKDYSIVLSPVLSAYIIAVMFLSHPVQTQAVSYVSQRFASLAALFYLLSICLYVQGRLLAVSIFSKNKTSVLSNTGYAKVFMVLLFFGAFLSGVLGMFTKEIVISLPIMVCFVEDIFFRDLSNSKRIKKGTAILILVLLVLFLIIPVLFKFNLAGRFLIHGTIKSFSHDGDELSLPSYLLTQLRVFLTFIRLAFLPINQNVDYDYPMSRSIFEPRTLFSLIAVVCVFMFYLKIRKKNIFLAFGLGWFFIAYSPNIVPRQYVIFEHKMYLISLGFYIFLYFLIEKFIRRPNILKIVMVLIILIYSCLTVNRNKIWKDPVTLWGDVVKKSPNKSRPYSDLGFSYYKVGRYKEALYYLNKAIELNPTYAVAYNNRGSVYKDQGKLKLAFQDYSKAIKLARKYATAYNNLGVIYQLWGQNEMAAQNYIKAYKFQKDYDSPYFNKGMLEKSEKKYDLALADFNRAIEINPTNIKALYNRADIYWMKKNYIKALEDFSDVNKLDPYNTSSFIHAGIICGIKGEYDKAILNFDKAVTNNPHLAEAYYNRGIAKDMYKRYKEALEDILKAKELGQAISSDYISNLRRKTLLGNNEK